MVAPPRLIALPTDEEQRQRFQRWHARSPKGWVIRTSCGPLGCSPRMPVNTHRRRGHPSLGNLAQGTVCKILAGQHLKPHKVRYYLEKGDPAFELKMAEILCVYPQIAMLREQAASGESQGDGGGSLAIVSYDEKPGIQAIATTAPDRPPLPGTSPTVMRDHEYKRHGTLTLMAGINLLTGHVHALVKDRHRSREFIEFLKLLDATDPADTAIEVTTIRLTSHARRRVGWRRSRSGVRLHLHTDPRVLAQYHRRLLLQIGALGTAPHPGLLEKRTQQRLMAFINDVNRDPVVHTWRYKIDDAA
jgi:hypothetical protein